MAKRKSDKQLTHENWNDDDAPEEIGSFQKASLDTLKGRVIRQARRRITTSESEPKTLFSGFSGFTNNSECKKTFLNSNATTANATSTTTAHQPFKFSFISNSAVINSDSKSSDSFVNGVSDVDQTTPKTTDSQFSSTLSTKSSDSESLKTKKLKELSTELQNTELPFKSRSNESVTPDDIFLQKLRSLNLLCTEWIIKHLNENLSYILTPIFDDYQKYLNKLKEERQRNRSTTKKAKLETTSTSTATLSSFVATPKSVTSTSSVTTNSTFKAPDFKSGFSKLNSFSSLPPKEPSGYTFQEPPSNGAAKFNFGSNSNNNQSQNDKGDSGFFKFSAPTPKSVETTNSDQKSLFSFGSSSTMNGNLFSTMTKNPLVSTEQTTDEVRTKQDQDESPPVVNETITEDGSVYEKKCKVFIKKNGSFVDHGIGFLFLKFVGDKKKCQMIVRANNKLATVMLNVLLSSSIPIQLTGANNVMLVCCPTPESKPSSVLLKVKTAQDAEELMNKLNEYKK